MSGNMSIGGLASGMDTKSLISQLMSLEQKPLQALQTKKTNLTNQNTAFQAINTRVSALLAAAKDLTLDLNIKTKSATSTNTKVVTATAGASTALGTYQVRVDQLATAGSLSAASPIGSAVTDVNAAFSSLNLSSSVTSGSFTLQYTNSGAPQTVSIAVNAGDSLQNVFDQIAAQTGAISASLVDNKIVLTGDPTVSSIVVGAGNDTSNFLSVMNLTGATYSGGLGGTMSSTSGIGVTQVANTIDSGTSLATGITSTSTGEFKINGVSISYDTTTDSINTVLSRINASNAGVTANYNTINDRITLTSRTTGTGGITVEDVSGNFLQATNLTGAGSAFTQGQNALLGVVGVNGFTSTTGAADFSKSISSSTNTFNNIIPGLSFTAVATSTGDNAGLQSITVGSDNAAITSKIKAFVDNYNQTLDEINKATAKGQPNAFDSDLRGIKSQLQALASSRGSSSSGSYNSLMSLGIGTTFADREHLTFDQTKLETALNTNADQVADLFQNSSTGLATLTKAYLDKLSGTTGIFTIRDESVKNQLRNYDDQIQKYNDRLTLKQKQLTDQFTAMETALSKIKSQQSAFMSQLSSLG